MKEIKQDKGIENDCRVWEWECVWKRETDRQSSEGMLGETSD